MIATILILTIGSIATLFLALEALKGAKRNLDRDWGNKGRWEEEDF